MAVYKKTRGYRVCLGRNLTTTRHGADFFPLATLLYKTKC